MTPPPNPADLPGPWPDVLAAYADGELDDHARAAVERWLAENPVARACVGAQLRLSPENWRMWRDAAAPRPEPAAWDAVRRRIRVRLAATRLAEPATSGVPWESRLARVIAVPAYALTACVVLFTGFGYYLFPRHTQQVTEGVTRPVPEDPLAGIPVLLIATNADVDVHRVDGAGAGGWLPVGGMPLAGPLALATGDDVELEEAEEHPAWPMGGPRVRRDPADAPLLFPGANR
jgi:anti-sigma factor RsiW